MTDEEIAAAVEHVASLSLDELVAERLIIADARITELEAARLSLEDRVPARGPTEGDEAEEGVMTDDQWAAAVEAVAAEPPSPMSVILKDVYDSGFRNGHAEGVVDGLCSYIGMVWMGEAIARRK